MHSLTATRETFGGIPGWSRAGFYLLAAGSVAIFLHGIRRRFRLWRQGRPIAARDILAGNLRTIGRRLRPGLRRLLVEGLGQKRVRGHGAAGPAHILLFSGFMMLLLGTTLLEVDHVASAISPRLHFQHGLYYFVYKLTLDLFGLLFLAGCLFFLWNRRGRTQWQMLAGLLVIGLTGYLTEGLRIAAFPPQGAGASCSPIGLWISSWFGHLNARSAGRLHLGVWWVHALLVFGLIASVPYTRLFHLIAGPLNLLLAPAGLGRLPPISLEEVESTGRVGASGIRDFTQQELLSFDACMECGRCQEACPAFLAGQPLSPMKIVQDLKGLMSETLGSPALIPERALHGQTIAAETLWSCTACSACVAVCPVRVDQLTLILNMRRFLVSEGGLSGTAATALRRLQSTANPWGLPAAERANWRS